MNAAALQDRLGAGFEVSVGDEAFAAACHGADVVMNGIVGFAGLTVTLETLRLGKRLGLANKESLIAAGPVVQKVRSHPWRRDRAGRQRTLRVTPVPSRQRVVQRRAA